MMIDYEKYRPSFTWLIRETEQCIFHIDSSFEANSDIAEIVNGTPNRHLSIAEILQFDFNDIKKKEKRQKYNYWFFSPKIVSDSGITPNASFKSTGSASTSGIDYVVYNDKWSNQLQHILHEEVHLMMMCEVGEAPSLFNEGIAVYTESIVYMGKDELYTICSDVWKNSAVQENGIVRKLLANEFFWNNLGKLPCYTIGAAVIYYIIECYGIDLLKDIFENTYFFDTKFNHVIESKTGISVDMLESEITKFFIMR